MPKPARPERIPSLSSLPNASQPKQTQGGDASDETTNIPGEGSGVYSKVCPKESIGLNPVINTRSRKAQDSLAHRVVNLETTQDPPEDPRDPKSKVINIETR